MAVLPTEATRVLAYRTKDRWIDTGWVFMLEASLCLVSAEALTVLSTKVAIAPVNWVSPAIVHVQPFHGGAT